MTVQARWLAILDTAMNREKYLQTLLSGRELFPERISRQIDALAIDIANYITSTIDECFELNDKQQTWMNVTLASMIADYYTARSNQPHLFDTCLNCNGSCIDGDCMRFSYEINGRHIKCARCLKLILAHINEVMALLDPDEIKVMKYLACNRRKTQTRWGRMAMSVVAYKLNTQLLCENKELYKKIITTCNR